VYGWSKPEKELGVLFYSYAASSPLLAEVFYRASSGQACEGGLEVLLNEESIENLLEAEMRAGGSIQARLPGSGLRRGVNILQFRFQECTHFALDWISIDPPQGSFYPIEGDTAGVNFVQHGESEVSFPVELPGSFILEVEYQAFNQSEPRLEIRDRDRIRETLRLSQNKTRYRKELHLESPGVYDLVFRTGGEEGSRTLWEAVRLLDRKRPVTSAAVPYERKSVQRERPNILLYVVDTLRADHLSCYGYERNTSPRVDRFASENGIYINAYAGSSWTRPSAASIFTGLMPKNHTTIGNKDRLPDQLVTLAEILKQAGYYTCGVSANGNLSHEFGFDQGFDSFASNDAFKKEPGTRDIHSDQVTSRALGLLDEYVGEGERKPLFLLVWTIDPHEPYAPPPGVDQLFSIDEFEEIDTYKSKLLDSIRRGEITPTPSQVEYMKARYDQEIAFNDHSWGVLLEKWKELGFYDNSVVIFTSDHGEEFFEHDGVGHGRTLYDDQIRIPLIIKSDRIERGEHSGRVQLIDLYPTIIDTLGIEAPYELDGISLWKNMTRNRTLFFEQGAVLSTKEGLPGNSLIGIVFGDKKLLFNQKYDRRPSKVPVPSLELYSLEDKLERNRLRFQGSEDEFRLQKLFAYARSPSRFDISSRSTEISQELREHLNALGYLEDEKK